MVDNDDIEKLIDTVKKLVIDYKVSNRYLLQRNNQLRRTVVKQYKYIRYARGLVEANIQMCEDLKNIIQTEEMQKTEVLEKLKNIVENCSKTLTTEKEVI